MITVEVVDCVVIGSGVAGLATALHAAAQGPVCLVTKASLLDSNTALAQGGIAAALEPPDSPQAHLEDTLKAGHDLCRPEAVAVLVEEGPQRVLELMALGARFDTRGDGHLQLGREAAHSHHRIVHARGDATGAEVAEVLVAQLRRHPRVHLKEGFFAADLLVDEGRCVGVWGYDRHGQPLAILARATVLATGGCGQAYRYTTNPAVATGDGFAMAYRAGARLVDMEFVQFHPTALASGSDPLPLISEAVRGEGALLVDEAGRRFMPELHPAAELAPRDVVARALFAVQRRGGRTYLDARSLGDAFPRRFPSIWRACLAQGLDPRRQPIPVTPAAHFIMGGVETDTCGRTNLPGLLAVGEVACTGVHGANRLASNSLLEGLVFARHVAEAVAEQPPLHRRQLPPLEVPPLLPPDPGVVEPLRQLMWEHVGIVRSGVGLQQAIRQLEELAAAVAPGDWVAGNLVTTALLIAQAAFARTESRGGHFRSDYPQPSPLWQDRHLRWQRRAGRPSPALIP